MRYLLIFLSFFVGLSANAQHPNVMIGNQSNPNEPCIAIDPKQPQYLIAASNINNYYLSSDTGATWEHFYQNSQYGVWGDPVLIADTLGSFYYFHLANPPDGNWVDRMVCQRSDDHGQTWPVDTYAGLHGDKVQDKEGVAVNPFNNHVYVTWTQFDKYNSADPQDSSVILFSRSEDRGLSWTEPVRLSQQAGDCLDDDNTVEGAVPAVGPNGEIYVAWAGPSGIVFDRSMDGGDTWLEEDIHVADMPGGWAMDVPGIYRTNGMPITHCDRSGGPYQGTIYVCWADQRNGPDNTDVWLSKSTDQGNTWSEPKRVNDDSSGRHQFFPWMAIDQTTGYLYFVFYDRRNYEDNQTDVYMAVSVDGGESFANFRISESPFVPNPAIFFGDYNYLIAHNGIVRPIWTRLDQGILSIWTALVDIDSIPDFPTGIEGKPVHGKAYFLTCYPNPAKDFTWLSFSLQGKRKVSLLITDLEGQVVLQVFKDKHFSKGKHQVKVQLKSLPTGVYYALLYQDGQAVAKESLVVDGGKL